MAITIRCEGRIRATSSTTKRTWRPISCHRASSAVTLVTSAIFYPLVTSILFKCATALHPAGIIGCTRLGSMNGALTVAESIFFYSSPSRGPLQPPRRFKKKRKKKYFFKKIISRPKNLNFFLYDPLHDRTQSNHNKTPSKRNRRETKAKCRESATKMAAI